MFGPSIPLLPSPAIADFERDDRIESVEIPGLQRVLPLWLLLPRKHCLQQACPLSVVFAGASLQTTDDSLAALFGVVLADFPLAFDRFDFDRKTDDGTQ